MVTKTTKKAKVEATDEETVEETPAEVGEEQYVPAPDQPGIVLTGTIGGKQGFVPAADAEKAGLVVTGKPAEVEVEAEAPKGKK